MQKVQLEILENTCKTLVNSGIIVYSTCTIFDEENFQVIEKFLAKHPEFVQVPLTHEKADIVNIQCSSGSGSTNPNTGQTTATQLDTQYPCKITVRALFAKENPFLFIKNTGVPNEQ